jgi:tyrosine-protein kinase Etk/Wzc
MNVYGMEVTAEALEVLQKHTSFTVLTNGLMTISFEDKKAERAASITNRYVELLDEFTRRLNVTRASRTKEFIGEQIELRKRDLEEAEDDLREFREEHQMLEMERQVNAVIDVISTLTSDAITLEVELEMLRQYASQNSQEYIRKKQKYDEILKQIQKFKIQQARADEDSVRSYFPTLDIVAEVGLELVRLMRRVQVEEKVQELLIGEYEKARIEEARDTPTVQVLDPAVTPEKKSRPKRKVLAIVGGLVGIGWSALLVLFLATWKQETENAATLRSLLQPIVSDFERVFRRKRG